VIGYRAREGGFENNVRCLVDEILDERHENEKRGKDW